MTCSRTANREKPLRVVIKTEKKERFGLFFQDYLREAEFTRRLNLAGCNEIITVIDVSHLIISKAALTPR